MHKPFLALTLLFFLAFSTVAFGQPCECPTVELSLAEPPQQSWWMVLLDVIISKVLVPIALATVPACAAWTVRKWGKKLSIEQQEKLITLQTNLVTQGITFAEEQARKALNKGTPTPGADKLRLALDFVHEQAEISGVKQMGEQSLVNLIESKLHQERVKPDGLVASDPTMPINPGTLGEQK